MGISHSIVVALRSVLKQCGLKIATKTLEGFVREIISKVQTMRKEAGFEVMDKIALYVDKNEAVSDIIQKNREEIQSEVLANNVIFGKINGYHKEWNINGENVELGVEKQ